MMSLVFASCGSNQNQDKAEKKATEATDGTATQSEGCKAALQLITDYKVSINMMTSCEQLNACQVNISRDLDAIYQKYEPLTAEEKASVQNGVTSLGVLINKKKTELGCQ